MATWIVAATDVLYLYYIGWNRSVSVPFRNALGLAVSRDNGRTFAKLEGPILDRSRVDPFFVASASVLVEGGLWRMWYVSSTGWPLENGVRRHQYLIKYAESGDGLEWHPTGRVCIGFASPEEYAISRPCVLTAPGGYQMWYSWRGSRYRIGYAESKDGLVWTRRDAFGLECSGSGWDADMVEYPFVFDDGVRRMLYNGNGYGQTGIGLAELAESR